MKKLFLTILFLILSNPSIAQTKNTLFGTSVRWQSEVERQAILASVPSWQANHLNVIVNAFYQPETDPSFPSIDHNHYNVNFINSLWGPRTNPYVKFGRPAKLFVFIGENPKTGHVSENTKDNYFIAPLIRNLADREIYVFEKSSSKPVPLSDWMNALLMKYPKNSTVRINVCSGYATEPDQHCESTDYQQETWYIYNDYADDAGMRLRINTEPPSAKRDAKRDWHTYIGRHDSIQNDSPLESAIDANDTEGVAKALQTVPVWKNFATIVSLFETIRDQRYFGDKFKPGFLRRISWLMPQDGCWSRMSATIKDFFGPKNNPVAKFTRPAKIFVFGNLCVNTPNDESGAVTWWYHVAPIIRDAKTHQVYVFDPAVSASAPLPVKDWLAKISDSTGACANSPGKLSRISICNGYGVTPSQSCHGSDASMESYGMLDQILYLNFERSLQTSLGRDADDILGEHPPWLKDNAR